MTEPPRPRTPFGAADDAMARARETPPWLSPPPDRSPLERLQHCWVHVDEHGRVPALLLEWRSTPAGWEGRVVRPLLDLEDETWRVREEWLPAEQLERPAT